MKKLFFAFAYSLLALVASGQANYEDVVYLKNGSVIRGVITEQVPNESVKIKTRDNNLFVYKFGEILKITREEVQRPSRARREKSNVVTPENIKQRGYTNITELTFGRSFEESSTTQGNGTNTATIYTDFDNLNNGPLMGVHTINGYQFSPYVSVGFGIGMHIHYDLVLMPLFVDVRVNFMKKRLTPFAAIDGGYAFSRKEVTGAAPASDYKGGVHLSAAGGIKFFVRPKMALNLSLGFRYQEIEVSDNNDNNYNYVGNSYHTRLLRHGLLRFGFTF